MHLGMVPASSPQCSSPFYPQDPGEPVSLLPRYSEVLRLPDNSLDSHRLLRESIHRLTRDSLPTVVCVSPGGPGSLRFRVLPAVAVEMLGALRFVEIPEGRLS